MFSLSDDVLPWGGGDLLHGIDDDVEIFFIQGLEEDRFLDQPSYLFFGLGGLGNHFRNELGFFIEVSEDLSANALPAIFLLHLLLLFFLKLPEELRFDLFRLFFRI